MNFGPLQRPLGQANRLPRHRFLGVAVIMLATLGVLQARLVELTVIKGAEFRQRADENRILVRPIRAPRGVILDRYGKALTRNIPVTRRIDLPGDEFGEIEIEEVGRAYPYGESFAHVVGYVGEVSSEELKQRCDKQGIFKECPLQPGNIVGKIGLEKQYDEQLRGSDGAQLIEVDANGKLIRVVGEESPIPGKNLTTTLDAMLQQAMTAALDTRRGAAVAIDPVNGNVLGLVSSPGFDPNLFTQAEERDDGSAELDRLFSDTTNLPLFNRAISGEYPPGSIFKLITAAAGLATGEVSSDTTVEDTGEIRVGEFRFGNWYFDQHGRTEGVIGLERALARSNDIFFYKVGEWVGAERLAQWARTYGLGSATGIDMLGEGDGLVPDPKWKERQIGERWYLGNTYHMSIGQGDLRLTPLQAAVMASVAVTGQRCRPHLAGDRKPECQAVDVSENSRGRILTGMMGACSPGGTAFPFFPWNSQESSSSARPGWVPQVACKTGTAQHGGKETKPHAWIAVAAPITQPTERGVKQGGAPQLDLDNRKRIVLVVMLDSAGEGSYEAAPVAKQILATWFSQQ